MGWNSFNPVNTGKNLINSIDIAKDYAVENTVENTANTINAADNTKDFAAISFKFQGNMLRAGLEKSTDFSQGVTADITINGTDKFNKARNILPGDFFHPGEANPPSAQGLEFSETKGASSIAYSAKLGEVYKFPNGKQWKVVDVVDTQKPDQSGFRAVVLRNGNQVIVAFAGSDLTKANDVGTDIKQGLGFKPEQFDQAVALTNKWIDKVGRENVKNTGHSLGGALAAYAAIQTGTKATTVNSAPLALQNIGGSPFNDKVRNNPNITNYYVPGEMLTKLDESNPFDMRPGNGIAVKGSSSSLNPFSIFINHSLDNVAPDVPLPEKVG